MAKCDQEILLQLIGSRPIYKNWSKLQKSAGGVYKSDALPTELSQRNFVIYRSRVKGKPFIPDFLNTVQNDLRAFTVSTSRILLLQKIPCKTKALGHTY
jgi:hypothetical protein